MMKMDYEKFGEKVSSLKVKTLIAVVLGFSLTFMGYKWYMKPAKVAPYIKNQWTNFYLACSHFDSYRVPIILFDVEILPHVFKPRGEAWHDPVFTCRVLCKHHPEGKNIISFATLATKLNPEKDRLLDILKRVGFALHLSEVPDPRLHDAEGDPVMIPTYIWLAKEDHVFQITILHDRHGDYYWAGAVTDDDWAEVTKTLAPELSHNWTTLEMAVFPRYQQAYEMSHHLTGTATIIDNHRLVVPFHIEEFLKEYRKARFIECDHARAKKFHKENVLKATPAEQKFQKNAKQLLERAKAVLDDLKMPFWISSGTLLGWYRECGIIPHSVDVDIGVWIHDYKEEVVERMEENGLMLKNKFGKVQDSFELSFIDKNNVKLDIFFFYEEVEYAWNGGTRAYDAAKFKYSFDKFTTCWTEFVGLKVLVPCETRAYIEANYGKDWEKPVKEWVWYKSPPNVEPNGYWPKEEWDDVIQIYEPVIEDKKENERKEKEL